MTDFIKEIPVFLWPIFLLAGGGIVFALMQAVKLTQEIGIIIKSVTVGPAANGEKEERVHVLAALVEHIPKMSASLSKMAEEVPVHTELLTKIEKVNTRIDGRTLKTHNLLVEARTAQKRYYKKRKLKPNG